MLLDFAPRLNEVKSPVDIAAPQAIPEKYGFDASITFEATVIVSTMAIKPKDMCRNLSIPELRYQTLIAFDISLGTALLGSTDPSIVIPSPFSFYDFF
jgi:hypothetical protein